MGFKSLGFQRTADVSGARTLAQLAPSGVVPESADFVTIQCEGQPCRWRADGTAPTATVGNLLAAGATLTVRRAQFAAFQLIQTAASASVNADFCKTG